jgi:hypothetical protein
MDHIIKLPSQQSLFNATNNLVDLVIPANSGVYDLSRCYIAVALRTDGIELDTATDGPDGQIPAAGGLAAADAVADIRLNFNHNAAGNSIYANCAVPIEALVRDCSMFSSTRGKIEDIRRSDTLHATRKAYLQDMSDVQSAALVGAAGLAKTNPWASGRFAQLVGIGDVASRYQSHELRIYLRDLFNIAKAEEWDSAIMGDTRIHCELNIDRLVMKQNLGTPGADSPWARHYHSETTGRNPAEYRQAQDVLINTSPANPTTEDGIVMKAEYDSLEDSPFWVRQAVKITTTITVDAGVTLGGAFFPVSGEVRFAIIKSIEWDKTTKKITLKFGGTTLSTPQLNGAVADNACLIGRNVEGINVTAGSLAAANLVYQSIELNAVRAPVSSGPSQIQYTQYQTQQDQFGSTSTLSRSYFLPPQTTNCIVVLPVADATDVNGSDILGSARLTDYRFSINGETVTNRPVPYMPAATIVDGAENAKCEAGSSLHYDLISKTFMNQGQRFHSLREAVYDQIVPISDPRPVSGAGVIGWENIADCPLKRCYMLALPIPISNDQTQLTIELNGTFPANAGRVHIYSEVRSVA